jgi:hypothetical protein
MRTFAKKRVILLCFLVNSMAHRVSFPGLFQILTVYLGGTKIGFSEDEAANGSF